MLTELIIKDTKKVCPTPALRIEGNDQITRIQTKQAFRTHPKGHIHTLFLLDFILVVLSIQETNANTYTKYFYFSIKTSFFYNLPCKVNYFS